MRQIFFLILFICVAMITTPAHAVAMPDAEYTPYPAVQSPAINILPYGFVTINLEDETFYYCNGIFYQKIMRDQKYMIVPPPIGAVVFDIPQGYQYMLVDGSAYYVVNGIYYKRVLEGYRVISPPYKLRSILRKGEAYDKNDIFERFMDG